MMFRTIAKRIALSTILLLIAAPRLVMAQGAALTPELQAARKPLEKYNPPIMAGHDGFCSSGACSSFPNGAVDGAMKYPKGAMGVHFINMGNVGPKLDPSKPQVLI